MEYDPIQQCARLTDEERNLADLPPSIPLAKCDAMGDVLLDHAENVREISITQAATESWLGGNQASQEEAMEFIRGGDMFNKITALQRLAIALKACGIGETTEDDLHSLTNRNRHDPEQA